MSSEEDLRGKVNSDILGRYINVKESKPVRQGEFIGVEENKFYVELGEETIYELSPLAYYIWALCDGDHTIEQIAQDISVNASVELSEVIEPLVIVLDEMKKAGLVEY